MRQIRQFTKAIASLLDQPSREQPEETLHAIDEACRAHLGGRAEALRSMSPDALLEMCRDDGQFVAEAAQSMAQALQRMGTVYEHQEKNGEAGRCFARALFLYRHLLQTPDAPVSWQVGTTVAALAERVDVLPVDDAAQDALDALRNGEQ